MDIQTKRQIIVIVQAWVFWKTEKREKNIITSCYSLRQMVLAFVWLL